MNFYLLLVADFKRLLRNGRKGKFYVYFTTIKNNVSEREVSCTYIWIFTKTLKKKKKALKRNSVWFSVQYIKKIEPASEPAQGLFSYADVAWIKLLRDLFLRGKPRQQVAPALRY